jgi:cytoskeletal protein RodZ
VWTLGETLRQARLSKGVSMAEAARETRIRSAYLEALEAEDLASLPPPVYTRGFVRAYAEYLGLNPQAMVDLYQPVSRREPVPTLREAVPRVAVPRQLPLRPVLVGIGVLIGLAALVYAWSWYQSVQAAVRETEGGPRLSRGTPTALVRGQPTVLVALSPVPSPSPSAVPIAASPVPTLTPEPTPSPTPTPVVDAILVEFRAIARVYVEAAVDGKQAMAETLAAGTERSLPLARESVVLRASNGAALDVRVNGTRQEPQTTSDPVEFTWSR